METTQETNATETTYLQVTLSIKLPTEDETFVAALEKLCEQYAVGKDYFFGFE